MNYHLYTNTRDAAWQFLLENGIDRLPLSFHNICRANNIGLYKDCASGYFAEDERGVVFVRNGKYNILVNGEDSIGIQRFTIGHELGHIFFGHLYKGELHTRLTGSRADPKSHIEYQAERFAMGILAPACVIWGLDLHSAENISKLCNISLDDARYRADRMRVLYSRNKFLTSRLEMMVYKQFEKFISEYRK